MLTDNQNLQQLWDWDKRPDSFIILSGRIAVHFNPKLCPDEIQKLTGIINQTRGDHKFPEVFQSSNGEKSACNEDKLSLEVKQSLPHALHIEWGNYSARMADSRALLGYVIYSIEAPSGNVTVYEGRDACGGDGSVSAGFFHASLAQPN